MKSLFFTICIAALATPASARPWAAFYCGKLQVALIPSKYFDPKFGSCNTLCDGKTHYFDMQKDPDQRRPLSNRLFRTNDDGDLFYKSEKCQTFDEDDYDALDTPGMSRREIARQRRLRLGLPSVPPAPGPAPTTTCVPHPTLEGYQVCGQSLEEWDRRLRGDPALSVGPERRDGAAPQKTVLYEERGGQIVAHWERWKALAAQGGEVEIRGPCWSACTLIMAHIPRERLCFDKNAELNFHQARGPNGEPVMKATRWMVDQYPEDIRKWIKTMGGAERLPLPSPNHPAGTFYMLFPVQLWAMGYRKCAN